MSINPETINFYQRAYLTITTPEGPVRVRSFTLSRGLYCFHRAFGRKYGVFLPLPSLFATPCENEVISRAGEQPRFPAVLADEKMPELTVQGIYVLCKSWREAVALIRAAGIELTLLGVNRKTRGGLALPRILVSDTRNIPAVKPPLSRGADEMTHKLRQRGFKVRKQKRRPKDAPPPRLIATFGHRLPPPKPASVT